MNSDQYKGNIYLTLSAISAIFIITFIAIILSIPHPRNTNSGAGLSWFIIIHFFWPIIFSVPILLGIIGVIYRRKALKNTLSANAPNIQITSGLRKSLPSKYLLITLILTALIWVMIVAITMIPYGYHLMFPAIISVIPILGFVFKHSLKNTGLVDIKTFSKIEKLISNQRLLIALVLSILLWVMMYWIPFDNIQTVSLLLLSVMPIIIGILFVVWIIDEFRK